MSDKVGEKSLVPEEVGLQSSRMSGGRSIAPRQPSLSFSRAGVMQPGYCPLSIPA